MLVAEGRYERITTGVDLDAPAFEGGAIIYKTQNGMWRDFETAIHPSTIAAALARAAGGFAIPTPRVLWGKLTFYWTYYPPGAAWVWTYPDGSGGFRDADKKGKSWRVLSAVDREWVGMWGNGPAAPGRRVA